MAVSIENYIKNCNDVDRWLLSLFSTYARKLLKGKEKPAIYMNSILNDERREHKVREVFGHYGLIESINYEHPAYNPYAYGSSLKIKCLLTLNHKVFLKMAPKHADAFKFVVNAPDKSTDRIRGFPTLDGISKEGILHIFFHPDRYNVYDRDEKYLDGSGKEQERHITRVYPKKLETKAERDVFDKALDRFYTKHIEEYTSVVCGFQSKVLTNHKNWGDDREEPIKELKPERLNDFTLEELNKTEIKERINKARAHIKFYEATLSDLEQLKDKLPNRKIAKELCEASVNLKAPLMMSSEDRVTRELAALVMKGSNKGLV